MKQRIFYILLASAILACMIASTLLSAIAAADPSGGLTFFQAFAFSLLYTLPMLIIAIIVLYRLRAYFEMKSNGESKRRFTLLTVGFGLVIAVMILLLLSFGLSLLDILFIPMVVLLSAAVALVFFGSRANRA